MNFVRSANYAIYFKVAFVGILLCPSAADRRVDGADRKTGRDERRDTRQNDHGYLKRMLKEVKRFGEAIDSDAVAQAERAWDEFQPGLKKVKEEVLRAQEEILAFGDDMQGVLRNLQNYFPENRDGVTPGDNEWGDIGQGWKSLKRDATELVKETFDDVLGDVVKDIATLETGLSEALSEGNVRAAFRLWRSVLDNPDVQFLTKDRRLWEGAERTVRNYLNGFMTETTGKHVQRAINATADFTTHFADLSQNIGKTDHEVFQEISNKMCHLQGAAQKLWPMTKRALPLLGYEAYIATTDNVIKANILIRVTLTVSACALLGMNPRSDSFLMALIAAFSLGHLTKDFAHNLAAFFVKAFMDSSTLDRIDPVDFATELVSGASTCEELGEKSFAFFEAMKRALTLPSPSEDQGADANIYDDGDPALRGRASSSDATSSSGDHPRLARKLEKDALILRFAIWIAAVVDHPGFSLDVFLLALGMNILFCGMALGACCREVLERGRRRRPRGGEARKKIA